jgi:hypothetical protein
LTPSQERMVQCFRDFLCYTNPHGMDLTGSIPAGAEMMLEKYKGL